MGQVETWLSQHLHRSRKGKKRRKKTHSSLNSQIQRCSRFSNNSSSKKIKARSHFFHPRNTKKKHGIQGTQVSQVIFDPAKGSTTSTWVLSSTLAFGFNCLTIKKSSKKVGLKHLLNVVLPSKISGKSRSKDVDLAINNMVGLTWFTHQQMEI